MDVNWRELAACRGANFADFSEGGRAQEKAKEKYCKNCPVQKVCLWYAMMCEEDLPAYRFYLYGNMTANERLELGDQLKKGDAKRRFFEALEDLEYEGVV